MRPERVTGLDYSSSPSQPIVEMRGITKRFAGVVANDNANLEIRRGEVHALLGENGAGKTTLVHILSGLYRQNRGRILVDGEQVDFHSPRDAIRAGIGIVGQHFNLVDVFTVAENVVIGLDGPLLNLELDSVAARLADMEAEYGLEVNPHAKIWELSVGERQRVEILRMLHRGTQLLILDEPSAVLSPQEADQLTRTLRQMADAGRSVLYISHKLREVVGVSDRVTVLRSGRNVATVDTSDVDERELARLMTGEDVSIFEASHRATPAAATPKLLVESLNVKSDRGLNVVTDLSLRVAGGEILGIAGVAGNGQRELAEAIAGLRPVESGSVSIRGEDMTRTSPRARIDAGLSLVPEDRLGTGLVPDLGLYDNSILKNYRKGPVARGPWLNASAIASYAQDLVKRFSVIGADRVQPVRNLSGGNLQRLLLGRELSGEPQVMVAANPARGLDVHAAVAIHKLLIGQRENGTATLVVSEDLDELLAISDRIAVIYEGRLVGEFPIAKANVEELGLMMKGTVSGCLGRNGDR